MSYTKLTATTVQSEDTTTDDIPTDTNNPETTSETDNNNNNNNDNNNDLSQPLGLTIDTMPNMQVLSVEDPSNVCLICYKDLNINETRCVTLTPPPNASEPVSKTWHESCMTKYMKTLNTKSKPFKIPQTTIILSTKPKFKPSGTIPKKEKLSLPSLIYYDRVRPGLPKPKPRSNLKSIKPRPQSARLDNDRDRSRSNSLGTGGHGSSFGIQSPHITRMSRLSTLKGLKGLKNTLTPYNSVKVSTTYKATLSSTGGTGGTSDIDGEEFEPVLSSIIITPIPRDNQCGKCQTPIKWFCNIIVGLSTLWGIFVLALLQYSVHISLLPESLYVESNGVYDLCGIDDIRHKVLNFSAVWIIVCCVSLICKFIFFVYLIVSNGCCTCSRCCAKSSTKGFNKLDNIYDDDYNINNDEYKDKFRKSQILLLSIIFINIFIVGFPYGYARIGQHYVAPYYQHINNWPSSERVDDWAFLEGILIFFIMIGIVLIRESNYRNWRIKCEMRTLWSVLCTGIILAGGYIAVIRMYNDTTNWGNLIAFGEGLTSDYLGNESFEYSSCNYVINQSGQKVIYKTKIELESEDNDDDWSVVCKVVETVEKQVDLVADDNDILGSITIGENGSYLSCVITNNDDDDGNFKINADFMKIEMGECQKHDESDVVVCFDEVEYKTSFLAK